LNQQLDGKGLLVSTLVDAMLTLIQGDIRDTASLAKAFQGIEVVIHLACISNDASFELDERLSETINFKAFEPMVNAAKAAGVKRFNYASTSSVYGVSDTPNETSEKLHELKWVFRPSRVISMTYKMRETRSKLHSWVLQRSPNVKEDHPLVPLTLDNKFKGVCEPLLFKHQSAEFVCITLRPATLCAMRSASSLRSQIEFLTLDLVTQISSKIPTIFYHPCFGVAE